MLNHSQVELLKFLMKGRLLLLKHQGIAINLATQCISDDISLAWMILETHVIIFDQLRPSSLPEVQIRSGEQILQTFVVRIHLASIIDEAISLNFQRMDHCS